MKKYFEEYEKFLKEVREETFKEAEKQAKILNEFIHDWTRLISGEKGIFEQQINSLPGVIFLHSFKLISWISYEILSAMYFEALRDLRFVFEGSVYGVIYEDAIEKEVFDQLGKRLSSIELKEEIIELLEICRNKKVYQKRKVDKVDKEKIRKIVNEYFSQENIRPLVPKERKKYQNVYIKILSDERFYLPMREQLKECKKHLNLEDEDINELIEVWRKLSRYSHFSYPYLDFIIRNPRSLFIEMFNKNFLNESLSLCSKCLDFFYLVFAWRFRRIKKLKNKILQTIKWWKINYPDSFPLTQRYLDRLIR